MSVFMCLCICVNVSVYVPAFFSYFNPLQGWLVSSTGHHRGLSETAASSTPLLFRLNDVESTYDDCGPGGYSILALHRGKFCLTQPLLYEENTPEK